LCTEESAISLRQGDIMTEGGNVRLGDRSFRANTTDDHIQKLAARVEAGQQAERIWRPMRTSAMVLSVENECDGSVRSD